MLLAVISDNVWLAIIAVLNTALMAWINFRISENSKKINTDVGEVKVLVDGQRMQMIAEIAELRNALHGVTGSREDAALANKASRDLVAKIAVDTKMAVDTAIHAAPPPPLPTTPPPATLTGQ